MMNPEPRPVLGLAFAPSGNSNCSPKKRRQKSLNGSLPSNGPWPPNGLGAGCCRPNGCGEDCARFTAWVAEMLTTTGANLSANWTKFGRPSSLDALFCCVVSAALGRSNATKLNKKIGPIAAKNFVFQE